jgi:hypothetical protein
MPQRFSYVKTTGPVRNVIIAKLFPF